MPFVETEEQARHFLLGPTVYAENPITPWTEPIRSPQREAIDAAFAAGSSAGD
jgi:hydroxymethylglutaryl-CoA lyase